MGKLRSWTCKGCTNKCLLMFNGTVFEYCKPVINGGNRTEWVTDEYIACLDYTTDPNMFDSQVRIHPEQR